MRTRTRAARVALAFATAMLLAQAGHAQLFRSYVSSTGNDANPCTLPAPCRLLPAALGAVASGGEIWMLDSANYNTATVTVSKSVSILAVPGAVGSVIATGGPALSITAGGLSVALRNLVIVPLPGGGGTKGITMTGASSLVVERCLLSGLPSRSIEVIGTGTLSVVDSTVRRGGSWAIWLQNGPSATFAGLRIIDNAGGVIGYGDVASTTRFTISDSVISGGTHGVITQVTSADASVRATVTRSTVERATGYGLFARTEGAGSATLSVGGSTITTSERAWGIFNSGAFIISLGDNTAVSNDFASTGTVTDLAPF